MARYAMLACGCVLLLISLPLEAQTLHALDSDALRSSGFAHILPESALAVMVIPHLHATSERLQHYISTLALIKSLQPFLQTLSTGLQKFEDASGMHLADLGSIFQTSLAIALLDVEIPARAQKPARAFQPEVLLAAEAANSAEALQHLLEATIRRHILLRSPSVQFQTRTVQGITLWIVSNAHFRFAYAFLDHIFLLTTDPEYLEHLIARQHSGNTQSPDIFNSLYNAEAYRTTRQVLEQYDHDVHLYVNIRQLWRKLHEAYHKNCTSSSAAETQKDSLLCPPPPFRALTWLFSLKENGGHERIFWEMDCPDDQAASPDGVFWSQSWTTEKDLLISDQIVPANVLYYRAWQFNSSDWQQRWKRYLDSFLPVRDQEEIALQIQKLEQVLQLRVESDLLPAFGHEGVILWYMLNGWY